MEVTMSKGKVNAVPKGYSTATPYLIIDGAAKALDFYKRIFGAKEKMRMPAPGGKVGHAEIVIGNSMIMLADEHPEMGARSPRAFGGSGVGIMLYVEDVDSTVKKAVAEGARLVQPVEDKFYGDRTGTIEDPWGHSWHVGTHKEDVSDEEIKRRLAKMGKAG
jgi:PhnB protein